MLQLLLSRQGIGSTGTLKNKKVELEMYPLGFPRAAFIIPSSWVLFNRQLDMLENIDTVGTWQGTDSM